MIYRRCYPTVNAEQLIVGKPLPPGVGLCRGGEYAIRTGECSHSNPVDGDYIVYPSQPVDEEGELNYPEVWRREEFERTFTPGI